MLILYQTEETSYVLKKKKTLHFLKVLACSLQLGRAHVTGNTVAHPAT